jgi:hypothetical protein
MSRHEIDIEGLPEGWEPQLVKVLSGPLENESFGTILRCRRKVRKYDWSKTLPDVLVAKSPQHVVFGLLGHQPPDAGMVIAPIWQPNIHGKCPVDGEACIVRVRLADGSEFEGLAKQLWGFYNTRTIVAYQFIRLADGWEF